MNRLPIFIAFVPLFLYSTFSFAHHSRFGVFDTDSMVEIKLVLTEIKWNNPHVQFEGEAVNSDGVTQDWHIEATAVSMLRSRGLAQEFLSVGDSITIAGYAANSGDTMLLAINLLLEDGTEVLIDNSAKPYFANSASSQILQPEYDLSEKDNAIANADGIFRVWSTVLSDPAAFPMFKGGYPLNEAAAAEKANWNPDPEQQLSCWAKDMPLLMVTPHPIEFSKQGENILMRFEEDDAQRLIYMNSDNQAATTHYSSMGLSIGSWQGNTLVVETNMIDAQAFDDRGTPVSRDLELVERFTLSDDESRLDYQISFDDPQTFTEPFNLTRYWVWKPERAVHEWDCAN